MQALAEGDLSQHAHRRIDDFRLNPPHCKSTAPPTEPVRVLAPGDHRRTARGAIEDSLSVWVNLVDLSSQERFVLPSGEDGVWSTSHLVAMGINDDATHRP